MRKAAHHPPVFLRRGTALVLLLALLALAGCAGETAVESPETAAPTEAQEIEVDPAPTEAPTAEPEPTAGSELDKELYYASSADVRCYSQPSDAEEYFLGTMNEGTVVTRLEEQGTFMRVQWNDGEIWCRSWYLTAQDADVEAARDEARLAELSATPGYLAFDAPEECYSTASMLNCREQPNTDCAILDQLPAGTAVTLYGQVKSFGLVRLPNGRLCFCSTNYLSGGTLCAVYPGAVDLRALMPRARFELLFASSDNITGRALYPAIPLLEKHTADLLYKAYQTFLEDGYLLKIYDAYRPLSAQFALYDIVQDSRFIADPNNWGSWHQRGRAVDISLVDMETGEELEMPTPMHTFALSASRTRSRTWSEEARKNVDYMTQVMTNAGFGIIDTEWWHFEYTGRGNMLPEEINYDALTFRPASTYFD